MSVTLNWIGGKRFVSNIREFTITLDNPADKGGSNTGPMSIELLLTAIGGCYSSAFAYFAKK
jgi:putative redox protein